MSILYGNEIAVAYARSGGKGLAYPGGSVLSLVTWEQQEDKHWFGGNIPKKIQSVEMVAFDSAASLKYTDYVGAPLQQHLAIAVHDLPLISDVNKVKQVTLLTVFASTAQNTPGNDFSSYANEQSSLMVKAYEQKNTSSFHQLLAGFASKYNQLSAADQKHYRSYLANDYYNLSCTYALLGNKPKALEYLDSSIRNGYYNYSHLMADKDLVDLREDITFQRLAASTREIGDYEYILRKASTYNTSDNRALPAFTYQEASNPSLVALRKGFNLDSIAGGDTEVGRILNLLHWVHNLIPHDGNHNNPEVKNAMSMIAVCKKEGRGLNCRGLATVLNECYLAMGIPSRFVTCMPKDSLKIDFDCHVINAVYAASLKKWIWIDPTNDAYVMNEKGELQSIEEVRERIIRDQPLLVNPDANWNHKSTTTKSYYLDYYMAKNLYYLVCTSSSEYDAETTQKGKTITYINLLPLDYFKQKPDKTEYTNQKSGITFINYTTNNPAAFWAAPVK
ncbi:hypothetical protein F5148DRAFT_1289976 [Russula earlei]|uniref:Uncharacterized protein n=1 Tax=Russula earlei TaxID=71964 RepID=A0ACC0TXH0_9AGAM|nr:hypothetical protein F5148DRAFT_1289976 [Russula earlei]